MKIITKYEANDGTEFYSEDECRNYEARGPYPRKPVDLDLGLMTVRPVTPPTGQIFQFGANPPTQDHPKGTT